MGTLRAEIHEAWADGSVVVRPGESLEFKGTPTGVDARHLVLTFYADEHGTYHLEKGKIAPPTMKSARIRAVENVIRALSDAGFSMAETA